MSSKDKRKIAKVELLSPAGSPECFNAALNAGADAVYLGLDRFSARAAASNFTEDELLRCLDIAHIAGRRIYLTVNTLFKDEETEELYDLLYKPYINGLDAVIVQDIGVMSAVSNMFPELPIHVSTQAAITAAPGVSYVMRPQVKRVVPARELTLGEIRKMKDTTGLELECFIHGSLCYSYSGKCLLSSFIGGRSGNRGRCAQPCRLSYDGSYPLSLKDLCVIRHIPDLIDAGIDSFKIEGRMKNSDYVYGVTSTYRKYIDMYHDSDKYLVSDRDIDKLIAYYTRSGNCNGYYYRHNGKDMITPDSPSYISAKENADKPDHTDIPTVPLNVKVTIKKEAPVTISLTDNTVSLNVNTDIVPETAVKQSLTKEDVLKQIRKTGGTCFVFNDIAIDLDDGLFIPNSGINKVRRQGIEAFSGQLLKHYIRKDCCNVALPKPGSSDRIFKEQDPGTYPAVTVSVLNAAQFETALKSNADSIVIPMALFLSVFRGHMPDKCDKDLYIHLPYVVREENMTNSSLSVASLINDIKGSDRIRGIYVSNNESVGIAVDHAYEGIIVGDVHLYVWNKRALDHYVKNKVSKTTVPIELNVRELINRGVTGEELIVYGRLPMMISAGCVYNTEKGCDRTDDGHFMYITDRKGEKLFVNCCCKECTNIIYNSVPISIADEEKLIKRLRPSSVRFCFTDESPEEMERILDLYFMTREPGGFSPAKLCDRYTRGHINRGAL